MSKNNTELSLSPRINEIVTFYFNNPDMTFTALSKQFGVSVPRISQIMSHPKVLQAYPILAKRHIKSMLPKAAKRAGQLMSQNVNLNVAEKVTMRILDSEKVLEPVTRHIIHEIQTKSVKELQDIIEGTKSLPRQVIDAEIVQDVKEEE